MNTIYICPKCGIKLKKDYLRVLYCSRCDNYFNEGMKSVEKRNQDLKVRCDEGQNQSPL